MARKKAKKASVLAPDWHATKAFMYMYKQPETPRERGERQRKIRQSKRPCQCPQCGDGVLPALADPGAYAKILAKALEAEAA